MVFGRNLSSALHAMSNALLSMHGIKTQERSFALQYQRDAMLRGASQANVPFMQQIVDILMQESGGVGVTLDKIILRAAEARPLMGARELADLRGLNLRGVVFNQKGIDILRSMPSGTADLQLDLRGADIRGGVFKPASTFEGVLIDEATVGAQTNMRHLTFDEFDHKANITILKGDVSYMRVMGASGSDASKHANIHLGDDVVAQGLDISGSCYTVLIAGERTNLVGMTAHGARALRTNIEGAEKRMTDMRGADFAEVRFAPGSHMRYADLSGADFSGVVLGDMDFSGSRMVGVNLKGVDITPSADGHSPLHGVVIDPTSLVGARYQGQVISRDTAQSVHRELGLVPPGKDVTHEVIRAQDKARAIHRERDEGSLPYRSDLHKAADEGSDSATGDEAKRGASISAYAATQTLDTDNLISALYQVNELMSRGGVTRKCGYDRHDRINAKAEQAETNRYRNDHSDEWTPGGPGGPSHG